jgi:hypothetical protein
MKIPAAVQALRFIQKLTLRRNSKKDLAGQGSASDPVEK